MESFVAGRSEGDIVSVVKCEVEEAATLLRVEAFVIDRSEGGTVSIVVKVVLGSGR
jgi:hypothetical protein